MRLTIETYLRATGDTSGYLALAVPEGHQLSEAGVCGDESERRAIIGAVHSYFNRLERPVTVTVHPIHPADGWIARNDHPVVDRVLPPYLPADVAISADLLARQFVYIDQTSIERALEVAIAANECPEGDTQKFCMRYRDQGGTITVRTIIPSKVERRERGSGFPETYLVAYDTEKDEPRTFRADRIERLEAL